MPATKAHVRLLACTPDGLSLIFAAFRQCYAPGFAGDLWDRLLGGEVPLEKQAEFVNRILESGHESPIEHVSFTFAIEGVSRALTPQLVRHRIASYSQQSQRYVDASHFNYILPPSIAAIPEARELFEQFMDQTADVYSRLQGLLLDRGKKGQSANEDARFVLPQAAETKIVATMNCRSLINFFELRCCMRAQWEIRGLALAMLDLCRQELPVIFNSAGAKCERLGYCPESENFTCGRYPRGPRAKPQIEE